MIPAVAPRLATLEPGPNSGDSLKDVETVEPKRLQIVNHTPQSRVLTSLRTTYNLRIDAQARGSFSGDAGMGLVHADPAACTGGE